MNFSLSMKILLVFFGFAIEQTSISFFSISLAALAYLLSDKTFFKINTYTFWSVLFVISVVFSIFSKLFIIYYLILCFLGSLAGYFLWKNLDEKKEISKPIIVSLVFLTLYLGEEFFYRLFFHASVFYFLHLIMGLTTIIFLFLIYVVFQKIKTKFGK